MSQKILVVDDEKLIRWTLEQHLVKEGYEVVTADSRSGGSCSSRRRRPTWSCWTTACPRCPASSCWTS